MTADRAAGDEVFVLWHARHLIVDEEGRTAHRDPDGEIHLDEEEWRILGIFRDEAAAEAQRGMSRKLPGFRDEPDCFDISPWCWTRTCGPTGISRSTRRATRT